MRLVWMRIGFLGLALLLPALAGVDAAPARSGHVVSNVRQTAGGKTETTVAEFWYTSNRYRLVTRRGTRPARIQLFDGAAVYDWIDGARSGQRWHPTALNVAREIVGPTLSGTSLAGRKQVGAGKVLGIPCRVVRGTRSARSGEGDWWKGTLQVRLWESRDPRFPYALRSTAKDASGDQATSEVTELDLDVAVPARLFHPPAGIAFYRPADVRSGWRVAGGPLPITGTIAFHFADRLSGGRAPRGRGVVALAGRKYVLDRQPIATRRDVDEARVEAQYTNGRTSGVALMIYLRRDAAKRVAHASARARGRYLVILLNAKPATALPIGGPWAEETTRFAITGVDGKELSQMANSLGRPKAAAPKKPRR